MEHYFTNNDTLKSEIRKIEYSIFDTSFIFYSDLGVFSKNKIDFGSQELIKEYLKYAKQEIKVLDVGCGYGYLGVVVSKITNSEVTMVDVNKRALHLAKRNIEHNKVNANALLSDAYENVKDIYDVIMTNPPIRAGKAKVLEILIGAKERLKENGELWFVIRKDQGAKSIAKELIKYYNIEILNKSKGFYIFKAKTNWLI